MLCILQQSFLMRDEDGLCWYGPNAPVMAKAVQSCLSGCSLGETRDMVVCWYLGESRTDANSVRNRQLPLPADPSDIHAKKSRTFHFYYFAVFPGVRVARQIDRQHATNP